MKLNYLHKVFILASIFIFVSTWSCETAKNANTHNPYGEMQKLIVNKSGMAGFELIEITPNQTNKTSQTRGAEQESKITKHSEETWEALNEIIRKIDLNQIDSWEAPTQERFHDGARAVQITISMESQEFNSHSFDEGKPPAELSELYNYLVSLENQ